MVSLGGSPSEFLCPKCPNRFKECAYFKERSNLKPGIYFITHHMLQYLEDFVKNPSLIILDENIQNGFLLEESCEEHELRQLQNYLTPRNSILIKYLLEFVNEIARQLTKNTAHTFLLNAKKLTKEEHCLLELLAKKAERTEGEIIEWIRNTIDELTKKKKEIYAQGVNLKSIHWLTGFISDEIFSFMEVTSRGLISFKTKHISYVPYKNVPIKILDATGDKNTAEALLKRPFQELRLDVKWEANLTHVITNTSRRVLTNAKEKDFERLLNEVVPLISTDKVLVVTYQFLKDTILRICNQIAPDKKFLFHHFQGPRGINDFEDCNGVIVIGFPYPAINSCWQDAHILFADKKDEEIKDQWITASAIWELAQVTHRIRPVNKKRVEIVIVNNFLPSSFPNADKIIDKTRDENWLEKSVKLLDPLVKRFGFLNPDIGFLAGVYPKEKETIAESFMEKIYSKINELNCSSQVFCSSVNLIKGKDNDITDNTTYSDINIGIDPTKTKFPFKNIGLEGKSFLDIIDIFPK
ncbi:MAG: hypothetical protein V1872_05535 [bacterium]